jgi:hypothetical protein
VNTGSFELLDVSCIHTNRLQLLDFIIEYFILSGLFFFLLKFFLRLFYLRSTLAGSSV